MVQKKLIEIKKKTNITKVENKSLRKKFLLLLEFVQLLTLMVVKTL